MAEKHPNKTTRDTAIGALGRLAYSDKAQRPLLAQTLFKLARPANEEWVRTQAIANLGFRREADWPFLAQFRRLWEEERVRKGGSIPVQAAILSVYGLVGPAAKAALPDVLPVLKDNRTPRDVYRRAMGFVDSLGPEAQEALPVLRAIANDDAKTEFDRQMVRRLIQRITDGR
jgi:hypothetical protein